MPPPPPPPPTFPDLVISALELTTFTVRNQGNAAAGPFSVQVVGFGTFAFSGLAAGAQETRTYTNGCAAGIHEARADYLNQVVESDETNNIRSIDVIC
jgi:subtilase family serine protease